VILALSVSASTKIIRYQSYVAWAGDIKGFPGYVAKKLMLPAELISTILLAGLLSHPIGTYAALVISLVLLAASLHFKWASPHKSCACYGKIIPPEHVVTASALLVLVTAAAAILAGESNKTPVAENIIRVVLALILVTAVTVASLSAEAYSETSSLGGKGPQWNRTVPGDPSAIIESLQPEIGEAAECPIFILLIDAECDECHRIAGPFHSFARAFPENALYITCRADAGTTAPASAQVADVYGHRARDIARIASIRMYPSLVVLRAGAQTEQIAVFEGIQAVRGALGLLIR